MNLLYQLEETIAIIEQDTQKALSMVELGVNTSEAFEDVFISIDKAEDIVKEIAEIDEGIKLIAMNKMFEAQSEFELKLNQVNSSEE